LALDCKETSFVNNLQASAVAQAALVPDLRGQDERRVEAQAKSELISRQRLVALSALAGIACGASVAYYMGVRVAHGIIWGAIGGSVVGRLAEWWKCRADSA
jgi:hypothetical protein